jgi:hypothetical protein
MWMATTGGRCAKAVPVYGDHPPIPHRLISAFEYDLTPLGRTLLKPMAACCDWAQAHLPELLAARQANEHEAPAPFQSAPPALNHPPSPDAVTNNW